MGKAGNTTKGVNEACVWEEIAFERVALLSWRSFGEEVDNIRYLSLYVFSRQSL